MLQCETMTNEAGSAQVPQIEWKEFLERYAPGKVHSVTGLAKAIPPSGTVFLLETPILQLYCDSEDCKDHCFFKCTSGTGNVGAAWQYILLHYKCRNCDITTKTFAVRARLSGNSISGEAVKLGEWPPFGPHVPSRVITLLRDDRELFFKGRRAESQGLGIGAYAYYRRVVENQKDRLIEEIIKVANRTKAGPEILATLEVARKETQFTKALNLIKEAIPPVLRIDGQSPLQLLHEATSKGIHELSDEECLARAEVIRLALTKLADRISQALKDERELREAVGRLTRPSESKAKGPDAGQES